MLDPAGAQQTPSPEALEQLAGVAVGEPAIKPPAYPLNVLKDTYIYDHGCYRARSDEYQRSMADPPYG